MISTIKKIILVTVIILILISGGKNLALAEQGYVLLEPEIIEGAGTAPVTFIQYAKGIFVTILTLAIILAILMIVIGGLEYMFSAVPGSKSEGKDTIKAALFGLLIALAAWLILFTINPDILEENTGLFDNLTTQTSP